MYTQRCPDNDKIKCAMNNEMVLCKCGFGTECPIKKQNVEKIYDTVGHLLLIFTVGPILLRKLFRPPSNIFFFSKT